MSIHVAVIPARGGSKRLPGKNIKLLAGKPMIAWTIEAAINSKQFNKIIVSTDCEEIKNISIAYGADVPYLRNSDLASDTATTSEVIEDIVQWLERKNNQISTVTILQPTSPLRNAAHIIDAFSYKQEKKANAVVSVCKLEHPIDICNVLPDDLSLDGFIAADKNIRSQDCGDYFRINGAIYIIDRKLLPDLYNMYRENSYAYIMDAKSSIDIDELIDFNFAEYILRNNK